MSKFKTWANDVNFLLRHHADEFTFNMAYGEHLYERYEDGKSEIPKWRFFPVYVCEVISYVWAVCICAIFGHQWVDDSTAGPDSGDVSVYCDRCSMSHRTILY